VQDLAKEESQTADCDDERTDGQLLLSQQMQQVILELLVFDLIGRAAIKPG
jgi:hypothetical protein